MTSRETGECCVCGKETADRCGACAAADFSLFFCSREHQKLIWPVHKRVCGPGKCSPFLWPFLTKDEADEAKKHMHDVYSISSTRGPRSLVATMERVTKIAEAELPGLLHELTENGPQPATPRRAETRHLYLFAIRQSEYRRLRAERGFDLRGYTFHELAGTVFSLFEHSGTGSYKLGSLPPLFFHLLLVMVHLSQLSSDDCSRAFMELAVGTLPRLRTYLDRVLRLSHPEMAEAALEALV